MALLSFSKAIPPLEPSFTLNFLHPSFIHFTMGRVQPSKKVQMQKQAVRVQPKRTAKQAVPPGAPNTPAEPSFPAKLEFELGKLTNRKGPRDERIAAAGAAQRRNKKIKSLGPQLSFVAQPLWVHVGNLDPMATEPALAAHFAMCGNVQYVNIRYSSSGKPGNPSDGYTYAIVKFETLASVQRAAAANGSALPGSQYRMVVSPELLTLPEVQKLPEFRHVRKQNPVVLQGIPQTKYVPVAMPNGQVHSASGPVDSTVEIAPTKIWTALPSVVAHRKKSRPAKRIRVAGVSFSLTLT
ncbi:hypothetical protein C8F04DRAFT_1239148 [Mycena alexandri]|uniref:RRM domain-containing protein n=1 Tax=Mycena alexandri TaxID=1745969 RepID=A0AAD6SGA1_9AGAR|nr:hypothetical protein C8F04DRAFT_1239148 [Mycena alexandri]